MKVYTIADHIISPLGDGTAENFRNILDGNSGINKIEDSQLSLSPFYAAQLQGKGLIEELPQNSGDHTRLERMFIHSIQKVIEPLSGLDFKRLLLIISTTKGNIDLLENNDGVRKNRVEIPLMAEVINSYFGFFHDPLVISNACISGVSAIITGSKMIKMGLYDHVIVSGGDLLSEFVVSGFQSLKAISESPCKPYDCDRTGINLGEACGTVLLSINPKLNLEEDALTSICGGGQSNDANHISGPSRTGKGLNIAISKALAQAKLNSLDIDLINAHGTATSFNDEMEALAFNDLKLGDTSLNSLKGYFGHTLGAAGIIESIMTIRQLKNRLAVKSMGYDKQGTSKALNVLKENKSIKSANYALKTVSGFGGCNAAIIFGK